MAPQTWAALFPKFERQWLRSPIHFSNGGSEIKILLQSIKQIVSEYFVPFPKAGQDDSFSSYLLSEGNTSSSSPLQAQCQISSGKCSLLTQFREIFPHSSPAKIHRFTFSLPLPHKCHFWDRGTALQSPGEQGHIRPRGRMLIAEDF